MKFAREQLEAIRAPNSPVLVIAGAGTGKTTVLIERIVKYLNDNIEHRRILIITFTNKAKDEIRERLTAKLNGQNVPGNIFTFHSFFHRVLKKDIEHIDPELRNFQLMDDGDQRSIIKRLSKHLLEDDTNLKPRNIQTFVSRIKSATPYRQSPSQEVIFPFAKKYDLSEHSIRELIDSYNEELRNSRFLDYDDLEIYSYEIFKNPQLREYWTKSFDAILIDEFQDTSSLQFEILKKLTDSKNFNLFCVGDPDQSIYGFRGAKPEVCNEFIEHYDSVQIKKLQLNYRSTKNILEVSNHLINKSKSNFSKILHTNNEVGEKVECAVFSREIHEAQWVIRKIIEILREDKKASLQDFAILFRSNYLSKAYELELRKSNLDYYVVNSIEFFSRSEIKFIIAVLQIVYSEVFSFVFLENIKKAIPIGLGDPAISALHRFSVANKYTFMQVLDNLQDCSDLTPRMLAAVQRFGEKIKRIHEKKDVLNIRELMFHIVDVFDYRQHVLRKNEGSRLDNIEKLSETFMHDQSNVSIKEKLEALSLKGDEVSREDAIVLSTIHQMKGLEFKYVFVVKCAKSIFPSVKSNTIFQLQEERRLAYVAFTRAKKLLLISSSPPAKTSTLSSVSHSEYIDEIKQLPSVKYRNDSISTYSFSSFFRFK